MSTNENCSKNSIHTIVINQYKYRYWYCICTSFFIKNLTKS